MQILWNSHNDKQVTVWSLILEEGWFIKMCSVTFDEFKMSVVHRISTFFHGALGDWGWWCFMAIDIPQIIFRWILFTTGINMALYYRPQIKFSIGFKSGGFGSQTIMVLVTNPSNVRNCVAVCAAWDGALSCMKMIFLSRTKRQLSSHGSSEFSRSAQDVPVDNFSHPSTR